MNKSVLITVLEQTVENSVRTTTLANENCNSRSAKKLPSEARGKTPFDKAFEKVLDEVCPVSPPTEAFEKIQSIATQFNLSHTELFQLVYNFLENHDIDPHERPPAVILRSGYQVSYDKEEELLDHLTTAILGETLHLCREKHPSSWSSFSKRYAKEISDEIEHIQISIYDKTVRVLFGWLLYDQVYKKYEYSLKEIFPHWKADPERVSKLLKDTKQAMVLLLGKDTGKGYPRLRRIKKEIEKHGMVCVLIREQPEHPFQSLIGKVLLYAMLAKYVIVESSYPSGALYELPFVRNAEAIIVMLQESGRGATRMYEDMIPKHKLVKRFFYKPRELEKTVQKALQWAEKKLSECTEIHKRSWSWLSK